MNKIKINLDRVGISSEEISKKMNFEDVLACQKIMAKPFYRSTWFFGVTGLATVSLIAGSIYSMKPEGDELYSPDLVMESVPKTNPKIVQLTTEQPIEIVKEVNKIKKESAPIEEINTLVTTKALIIEKQEQIIVSDQLDAIETELVENTVSNESVKKSFSFMDLYPRISGRINGGITKEELLNDEGLVTNTDVKIISFQLHLIDGTGGRVFESKGNMLNGEMKTALSHINIGEEIYFEKIDGQSVSGDVVRLSPIRYVLLN